MEGSNSNAEPFLCRKLGFDMYLLSAVEGPSAILNYLCKTYQLHNIPLATREGIKIESLRKDIVRFYIGEAPALSPVTLPTKVTLQILVHA